MVLPTPPLPAPTAITFLTPGSGGLPCSGADTDFTTNVVVHVDVGDAGQRGRPPRAPARASASRFDGDGVASSIANDDAAAVDADVLVLDELERHDIDAAGPGP